MPRPSTKGLELARTYRWAVPLWLLHGLVFGTFLWASSYFRGSNVRLGDSIWFSLPASALWCLATPFIVALARRVPLARGARARGLSVLLVAGVALHVVIALVQYSLFRARMGQRWVVPEAAFLADWSITDLIRFGVVVAGTRAVDGWRTTQKARRRAQRLRQELAEAELELLHLRLQPHFLFNALSAITELVHVDPARADQALVAMGDLLRRGLASSGRPVVPLSEELEGLEAYLALERIRWSHRLDVRMDVDPRALGMGVPNFALQPIVENCLRHGLKDRAEGRIRIAAQVVDGRLMVTVEDDGAGLPALAPVRAADTGGRGLANVRERLVRLYGDAAELALVPGPAGGAVARLTLPARPVAALAGHGAAKDDGSVAWSA